MSNINETCNELAVHALSLAGNLVYWRDYMASGWSAKVSANIGSVADRIIALRTAEAREQAAHYEVIVGNIGTVYAGSDRAEADSCCCEYVDQSTSGYGRASGESVVMLKDGEIVYELSAD